MQPRHAARLVLSLVALTCPAAAGCAVAPAYSSQESLEAVFARVHTAVVTLRTTSTGPVAEWDGAVVTEEGLGSGTLVSRDGHVLTAAHVVQTAEAVGVEFFDGRVVPARVVASDPVADLAMVRLEDPADADGAFVAFLGDSSAQPVGSQVFAVGAPLGVTHTLTTGILSARRMTRSLVGTGSEVEVLQTDAAINPGNSGGPLFNLRGEVIGVVSFIIGGTGGNQGLGFAVSARTVQERMIDRSPIWSGMSYVYVTGPVARALNLPPAQSGLLVQRVVADSPAARLGLRGGQIAASIGGETMLLGGDVILSVAGVRVSSQREKRVLEAVSNLGDADELVVEVLRGGKSRELRAPMSELRGDSGR